MDGTQSKNEIGFLQSNITNLESLNSSLEKAKALLEVKYKKLFKEKQEISEKSEDLLEEIESLKQTRSQQELQISDLVKTHQKSLQELELQQKTTNEYKNKLATLMVNSRNEPRSLTPVPKLRNDQSVIIEPEENENTPARNCRTVETENSPLRLSANIEKLLKKIEKNIVGRTPEIIIKWCQTVLGSENYLIRYPENDSMVSEDSKSNADNVSVASEANSQELSYKAHSKLMQQKKIIEGFTEKMKDKKIRIRVLKEHIKSLQGEIRKLDLKIRQSENLDVEFLKGTMLKFSSKLSGLDNDSLTMLQIIFSQLGLGNEGLPSKDSKKKWGFFKSKEKK